MVVLAEMHIMDLLVALVAVVVLMELPVVVVDIQAAVAVVIGHLIQALAVTNTLVVVVDPFFLAEPLPGLASAAAPAARELVFCAFRPRLPSFFCCLAGRRAVAACLATSFSILTLR